MKTKIILLEVKEQKFMKKIFIVIILMSMLLIPYYSQAKEKEDRMLPEITLIGGDPLSSVSGILRNIAEARSDLHEDNLSGAKEAVSQAYTDIRFIRTFSPVAQVKNYIWIAKKHLSYEDSESLMKDLIVIHTALSALDKTHYVENVNEYIDKAMKSLEKKDKEAARVELEMANKALGYSGSDLPLLMSEEYIGSAREYLRRNEPQKADQVLKNAEQELQFVVIDLYAPLPQARKSLWISSKHYAEGEYAAAKKDLERAGDYLNKALRSGDAKTGEDAKSLLKDLDVLKNKMEKGEKMDKAAIEGLWERTKALAERDAEYMTVILKKVEKIDQVKKDLIDARMHILYAETYNLTTREYRKATMEIEKAEANIKNAMSGADEAVKKQLSAIDNEIQDLKAGVNKKSSALRMHYRDVEEQLYRLIHKS